jgi:hypothetical protein
MKVALFRERGRIDWPAESVGAFYIIDYNNKG